MDDDPNTSDISLVSLPPPRNIGIRPKVFINNITARLVPLQNNGIQKRKLIKIKTVAGNLQKPPHNIPIIKFLTTGDKYLNNDSQKINGKHNSPLPNNVPSPGKLYEISQPSSTISSSFKPIKLVNDRDDRLLEKKDITTKQNGTRTIVHRAKSIDTPSAETVGRLGSKIATTQQTKSLHLPRVITTIPNLSSIQRTNNNKASNINITTNSTTINMVASTVKDNTNRVDVIHENDPITHDCEVNKDNVNNDMNGILNINNDSEGKVEDKSTDEPTVENDYEFALRLQRELDAEEKRNRLRRKSEPKCENKSDTTLTSKTKSTKKESQNTKKEKKKEDNGIEGSNESSIKKKGRKTKKENVINKGKNDDEIVDKMSLNLENNVSLEEGPKKRGRKSKKGTTNLSSDGKKTDEVTAEKSSGSPASESSIEKDSNVDLSLEKYPRPRTMGFEKIIKNVYRCEPDIDYRLADEVCDCRPPDPNNIQANSGCGENCISRCMNLECHGCAFGRKGCSNRRMQRRQNAPVEAFWAGIKGWGLRAKADISKGDFIMEYCGEVLNGKQENRRARRYAKDNQKHHYFMHLTSLTTIDAYYKGNISRCMNHSCDPNAKTEKWRVKGITRVGFFATKNIKKGEEICFNYHFFNYGKEPQKCYCGSSKCKGTIGEAIPNDPGVVDDDYESSSCVDTDSPSENDSDEEGEGVDAIPIGSPPDENKNIDKKEVPVSTVSPRKVNKSPNKKSKIIEVKESTSSKDEGTAIVKDIPKKPLERNINKKVEEKEDMSDSTSSSDDEVEESRLVINKKEETPVEIITFTKEQLEKIESFKEKVKGFSEIVNKEAENKNVSSSTITKCCDMLNSCFSIQQSIVISPLIKRITEIKVKETQLLENGVLKLLTDHLSMNKFVDGRGCSIFNMDMLYYIEMLLDSIINVLLYEKMGKYAKFIAESQLEVILLEVYGKLVQMAKDSTISHNYEMVKLVSEIKEKVAYAKNKAKRYINEDPDAMKSTAIIEDKINRQHRKEARDYYKYSHRKHRYHDTYYRRREYDERRRGAYESRYYYSRSSYDRKRSPAYNCYQKKRRRDSSEDSYYNDNKRTKTDYRDTSYRGDGYSKRFYTSNRSPPRSYGRSRYRSKSVEKRYSNDSRKYGDRRKRSRSRSSERIKNTNSRKHFESPSYDKKDKDYRRDYKRKRSSSPRNSISRRSELRSHYRSRSPRRDSSVVKHRKDDDKRKEERKCDEKKIEKNKNNYKDFTNSSSKNDRNKYNEKKRSPSPNMSYDGIKKNKLNGEEKKNSEEKVKKEKAFDVKNKDKKSNDRTTSDNKTKDKRTSLDKVKKNPCESSPYVPTLKRRVDEIMGFSKDNKDHFKDEEKKEKDDNRKGEISLSDLHHQISLAHSKIKAINDTKPVHVKEISKIS
uniref:Histone-lysine N-methyltransferase n=1 Tax=Strongyloides stercoralis TaxID=6248 RepID=A0A0K0E842_STRER